MGNHPFRPTRRQALATGAAFFIAACRKSQPPRALDKPVNVVVFMPDSLRADHLGCYGHSRPTSPTIDRFAQSSIVFDNCFTAGSWTTPGVASMFTGTVPMVHQMMIGAWCKDEVPGIMSTDLASMDESFAAGGYNTAWFLCNANCRKELGFGRGFEYYDYNPAENPHEQMDTVLEWLADKPAEPFYLLVHEVDPHDPYLSKTGEFKAFTGHTHEELLAKLPETDAAMLHDAHLLAWNERLDGTGRLPFEQLSPAGLDYVRLLYDTEIRRVDDVFERLHKGLEDAGLLDNTILVITSDHGETFGEHGYAYHGNTVYGEELHVPFIVKLPGMTRQKRIIQGCSQIDMAPTLLALAGQEPLPRAQGIPLLTPDGASTVHADRPLYAYHSQCRSQRRQWDMGVYLGRHKLIRNPETRVVEFYDLIEDPGEQNDLAADGQLQGPEAQALLAHAMEARREHLQLAQQVAPPTPMEVVPEGHQEALEALGYM